MKNTFGQKKLNDLVDNFLQDLEVLKQAIAAGDLDTVETIFRRAKQARDRYAEQSAIPSP